MAGQAVGSAVYNRRVGGVTGLAGLSLLPVAGAWPSVVEPPQRGDDARANDGSHVQPHAPKLRRAGVELSAAARDLCGGVGQERDAAGASAAIARIVAH